MIRVFATKQRIKQIENEEKENTSMKVQELLNALTEAAGQGGSQKNVEFLVESDRFHDEEKYTKVKDVKSHHPTKVTIWLS